MVGKITAAQPPGNGRFSFALMRDSRQPAQAQNPGREQDTAQAQRGYTSPLNPWKHSHSPQKPHRATHSSRAGTMPTAGSKPTGSRRSRRQADRERVQPCRQHSHGRTGQLSSRVAGLSWRLVEKGVSNKFSAFCDF